MRQEISTKHSSTILRRPYSCQYVSFCCSHSRYRSLPFSLSFFFFFYFHLSFLGTISFFSEHKNNEKIMNRYLEEWHYNVLWAKQIACYLVLLFTFYQSVPMLLMAIMTRMIFFSRKNFEWLKLLMSKLQNPMDLTGKEKNSLLVM